MKTLILNYKFVFTALMSLPLALCSSDKNDADDALSGFEPIEITFTEDFFTDCNQTKTISRIKLSYEKHPDVDGDCTWYDNILSNDVSPNEISLILAPATLRIDISEVENLKKVTIVIYDNCGLKCTKTSIYENTSLISTSENTSIQKIENFTFDLTVNSTHLIVSSFEGYVQKIIFE